MAILNYSQFFERPDVAGFGRGFSQGANIRNLMEQKRQQDALGQIRGLMGQESAQQQQLAQQSLGLGEDPAIQQAGMTQEEMARRAREIDPFVAEQALAKMGMDEPSKRAEASRFAARIQTLPREQQNRAIEERAATLKAQGRDPRDTMELLDMSDADRQRALVGVQMLDLSTQQRLNLRSQAGRDKIKSASQREFESLISGMSQEDQEEARRIKAGLDPRATGSAAQTIAREGTTEDVAKSEATIRERKKFAEMTGANRAKVIDEGFKRVAELQQGIGNIDKAIGALDDGAQSGPLINRFTPTIRAQTKRLEQVRNLMALDVLNSATFGALSEKELRIVQQTAMPDIPPPELRKWLETRREGMRKLQKSIKEQVDFIDQGGTQAGYLRMKDRQASQDAGQQEEQTGNRETYEQRRQRLLGQ